MPDSTQKVLRRTPGQPREYIETLLKANPTCSRHRAHEHCKQRRDDFNLEKQSYASLPQTLTQTMQPEAGVLRRRHG